MAQKMASYQTNRASCGPAALKNALEAIGISRTEEELIALTGQSVDGTSARALTKALGKIEGTNPGVLRCSRGAEALVQLWYVVAERGRPAILCVDEHEHWAVASGYIGGRFVLVDSAELGLVFYLTGDDLLERWVGPDGKYYAIVV